MIHTRAGKGQFDEDAPVISNILTKLGKSGCGGE